MKRNQTIDVAKGIGIILVIVGHALGIPATVQGVIYSFHMPLFFFLAGCFFRNGTSVASVVRRNYRRLILPFLVAIVVSMVVSIACGNTRTVNQFALQLAGSLYSVPRSNYTFYLTPLWFLTCLFCIEIIYQKCIVNSWVPPSVAVTGCVIAGYILFLTAHFYFPWNFNIALFTVGFFHLGYTAQRAKKLDGKILNLWAALTIGTIWLVCALANGNRSNLAAASIGHPVLFSIASCGGIAITLALASRLRDSRLLSFYGRRTLVIFSLNYPVNLIVQTLVAGYVSWYGIAVIEFVCLTAIAATVNKIPFFSNVFPLPPSDSASKDARPIAG